VGEVITKGKQVDLQTHGRMIDHHLSQFLCKNRTEMVVMTEDYGMVETTEVMWIVLISLVPVMQ
jgi:hypothetical protein